jgi:hypothetical protein
LQPARPGLIAVFGRPLFIEPDKKFPKAWMARRFTLAGRSLAGSACNARAQNRLKSEQP